MKISKREIKELGINKVLGAISIVNGFGVQIFDVSPTHVIWKYSNENEFRKSKLSYNNEGEYFFRVGNTRYYLNEIPLVN